MDASERSSLLPEDKEEQLALIPQATRDVMEARALRTYAESVALQPELRTRNTLLAAITLGLWGIPVAQAAYVYLSFYIGAVKPESSAGVEAKDALGNCINVKKWLEAHKTPGARELVQGLKGDATYLITDESGSQLKDFGLNAVCTHLGCVVPWVGAQGKFMCPCHGSQYNSDGAVVRGPAPLPLALAHVNVNDAGNVLVKQWTKDEKDFRTGGTPWWG